MKILLKVLTLASLCAAAAAVAEDVTFKDGERVVFLGDSISRGGYFHRFITEYYFTRFPDRKIAFFNAGASGDTAGGCLLRLDEDVVARRPTHVAVMFGMNDSGAAGDQSKPDDAAAKKRLASCVERYAANMQTLAARVRKANPDVAFTWITPSIYDESVKLEKPGAVGRSTVSIRALADVVRGLPAKVGGRLVDFYTPMTAFTAERQKAGPSWTMIGPDRVHPREPGAFFMAYRFLLDQGAPAVVSDVTVDAAKACATKCENATVTEVRTLPDGVSFRVLEKAIPMAVDPAAAPVADLIPFQEKLNRETLVVVGLAAGKYVLTIDGMPVLETTAEELARGVNLSANRRTPQYRQALQVMTTARARWNVTQNRATVGTIRWWLRMQKKNGLADVNDLAAVKTFGEKLKAEGRKGFFEGLVPFYVENWPKRDEVERNVADLDARIEKFRRPRPHVYAVRRAGANGKIAAARSNEKFTWFRFTVKQTRGDALIQLQEFALYDAAGVRRNAKMAFHPAYGTPSQAPCLLLDDDVAGLKPGEAAYGRMGSYRYYTNRDLDKLLDDAPVAAGWCIGFDGGHPSPADPTSWIPVVMRLAADTPEIVACDVCSFVGKTYGRELLAWSLEGSTDGIVWEELVDVSSNLDQVPTSGGARWYSDDTPFKPGDVRPGKGFRFAR